MITKTLIHVAALAAGVAIIICVTLVARYLRENAPTHPGSTSDVIQCYDCTDKHCINAKISVQDCTGVCLKALASTDQFGTTTYKAIQVCYRRPVEGDSCPASYLEILPIVECSICRTDLCNRVNDPELFFEDSEGTFS